MNGMDLAHTPLAGLNLIEASAGTGKTYTLTGLYLRLLVEQSLSPEQILVVTYTNAATSELRERIRRRLSAARMAFERGVSDEPLIQALLERLPDRQRAITQLNLAIAGFDQAAIHTIHGFCQRVLTENAFETSQPFDAELVPDQENRLLQIADDFWRIRLAGLPDWLADLIIVRIGSPEFLLKTVRQGIGKPYLEVRGADWPDDIDAIEQRLQQRIDDLGEAWRQEGEAICSYLSDARQFKQTSYKSQRVAEWCLEMQGWLSTQPVSSDGFGNLKKFTKASVRAGLKKSGEEKEFKVFDISQLVVGLIESRLEVMEQAVLALYHEFYDYLVDELPRRQQAAGEWSYDDLLLQLDQSLASAQGERLALSLRQRYPAALVDEFQDTDPVQYRILQNIYAANESVLFLVGDPKQAIYSFRGADIFAYLGARQMTRGHFTLDINWRSTPRLIKALNTLFGANPAAFFYPQITYNPVKAAPKRDQVLQEKGDRLGPLRIWQLSFADDTSIDEIRQAVAEATVNEIVRLLKQSRAGRVTVDGRPLGGGDIAVLVRTHKQGRQIAAALLAKGVLSVRTAQENVFFTQEAEQLERLMLALVEPRREPLLRAALSCELLGWSGEEIDQLSRDDATLSRQVEGFIDYHRTWRDDGFIRMFRRLLSEREVEHRLLSYRDGERRLTNLYQLSELLHRQDRMTRPGMEGLLKWFSRQRQADGADEEERQLRLESDSHLVKIVTLHASKGLQYPLVFCPYLWDGGAGVGRANGSFLFHDPEQAYQPVFELGSPNMEQAREFQQEEALAENLRLLYVALTRAQYRCYMPWGRVKKTEETALAWLLHGQQQVEGHALKAWQSNFKTLASADIEQRLADLSGLSGGTISLGPLPADEGSPQLTLNLPPDLEAARAFTGSIQSGKRISSFSSLTAGMAADLPDHDALPEMPAETTVGTEPVFDIHGFPKGARPGSCLHAIFEQLDFAGAAPSETAQLVETTLTAYGLETHWSPVVIEMLESVLSTPLNAEGLVLRDVRPGYRINEMEFFYPASGLDGRLLQSLAETHGFAESARINQGIGALDFTRVRGFMQGFIDLVIEVDGRFYLLDYKSNWLGADRSCYAQTHLQEAMLAHSYPLQYLLYVLALDRYLAQRLSNYDYERHFGGIFYLFLRGMDPQAGPAFGVFAERPPAAFVQALNRHLSGGGI